MSSPGNMPVAAAEHGGDLSEARRLRPLIGADEWLDLSACLNPQGYPPGDVEPGLWRRLPDRQLEATALDAARHYYGAPEAAGVVVAAGSQQIIGCLPRLFTRRTVAIVAPTYSEHVPVWRANGHASRTIGWREVPEVADEILVLVNPNNPDGHLFRHEPLATVIEMRTHQGLWTVVDEAFMDLMPAETITGHAADHLVIVLKSVGKFFGLAGARVGFAVLPSTQAAKLRAMIGPWPVAGPALSLVARALLDDKWQRRTRQELAGLAARTRDIMARGPIDVAGGTDLFHYCEGERAADVFEHLLDHGIFVRRFTERPHILRVGQPTGERGLSRLRTAMASAGR